MAEERKLDASIFDQLRLVPRHVPPMDMLRTIVSALSYYDPEYNKNDHDANLNKAIRLTSQISMIVADYDRIRKGKTVVEPDRSLSHAANFLLMLNGVAPSKTAERALDIALILHADHELNASTFAARVTAATLSDMHSAITSAIGTLRGPLHGGANEAVFKILKEIDAKRRRPRRARQRNAGAKGRRSPVSGTVCITPKIRERRTCGRCRATSATRAAIPNGSSTRKGSKTS
jgi:citrate synthase